jgi:hypothetical protein
MESLNLRTISDEDLQALTGKCWQEWCELLDAQSGQTRNFSTIATHLMKSYELRRLYAQMIAVYYRCEWCSQQHTP